MSRNGRVWLALLALVPIGVFVAESLGHLPGGSVAPWLGSWLGVAFVFFLQERRMRRGDPPVSGRGRVVAGIFTVALVVVYGAYSLSERAWFQVLLSLGVLVMGISAIWRGRRGAPGRDAAT